MKPRKTGHELSGRATVALFALLAWASLLRADEPPPAAPSVYLLHLPGIAGEMGHDRRFVATLRQSNPGWEIEIGDWTGARRGLVALLDERGNRAQASRLADRLINLRRTEPRRDIIISAHSGGAGIAVWALEQLPPDVNIDTLVLLAPALAADYDLSNALQRVRGRAFVFSSRHDRFVLGLGTRLLGTIDRAFTHSGGYLGFRKPTGADDAAYRRLVSMPFRDEWAKLRNDGGHVGVLQPRFVQAVLAPLLLGETRLPMAKPPTVQTVGKLRAAAIKESSGIIASRRNPGVFWTVNDSGNPAELFAIDRNGQLLATVALPDVRNVDFEDLADDEEGRIYIADVGNNEGRRETVVVHRYNEPPVCDQREGHRSETSWELRYPGKPFDCEALFVWKDRGYLVSKRRDLGNAGLYEFDLAQRTPQTLRKIADLPIVTPVTSADISRDGTRVAIGTVGGVFLFRIEPGRIDQLAAGRSDVAVFVEPSMEAVCFDRDGILATTEKRAVLLFGWDLFANELRPTE
jgi:hypothetical protein